MNSLEKMREDFSRTIFKRPRMYIGEAGCDKIWAIIIGYSIANLNDKEITNFLFMVQDQRFSIFDDDPNPKMGIGELLNGQNSDEEIQIYLHFLSQKLDEYISSVKMS